MEHSVGAEAFQGHVGRVTTVADAEAPPRDLAAVGAALVTVVLWASAFVGIRSAGRTFGPGALSLGRLLVAMAALGTVMVAASRSRDAAALAYSGGVVAQKVVLRRLSPLRTIFLCFVIGAIACAPFVVQLAHELGSVRGTPVGWLVYLGFFPTALGFMTWAFALSRTDAGRLAATTYLVPPISVRLGWQILGETPVWLAYLGGALYLAGVGLSRRR
jgi:drug/metabolite transporter (DMT)-like permease